MKIGIIGLGNMADVMISAMLNNGLVEVKDIIGSAATQKTIDFMADKYKIVTTLNNKAVAEKGDVLLIAVKPQFLEKVMGEIKDYLSLETPIITIAAGKNIEWYEKCFERPLRIIRCMPNINVKIGEGFTAICPGKNAKDEDIEFAEKLMGCMGKTCRIEENLMDAFAALAGCAPAYMFMFIEALADAGVAAGMPRAKAYEAAARCMEGSAKMFLEYGKHPGELKDMVCSPGGTTIEGVRVLEERGFRGTVMDAALASIKKAHKV